MENISPGGRWSPGLVLSAQYDQMYSTTPCDPGPTTGKLSVLNLYRSEPLPRQKQLFRQQDRSGKGGSIIRLGIHSPEHVSDLHTYPYTAMRMKHRNQEDIK